MKYLLYLLLLISPLSAATYYVSLTGSDVADGSISTPWRTIQKGVNTAVAGDTVNVGPGDYTEEVVWTAAASGVSGNRITLDGINRSATTLKMFVSKPYWTIKGFRFFGTISGSTPSGLGTDVKQQFRVMLGAHFLEIQNCLFDKNFQYTSESIKWHGLVWDPPAIGTHPYGVGTVASNVLVRDCEFTRFKGSIAAQILGDDNVFRNNLIHNFAAGDGVWLWGRRNLIKSNVVHNFYESAGVGNHPDFIQTFGDKGHGSKDHIIDGNYVHDLIGQIALGQLEGHLTTEVKDWLWINNIFSNIGKGLSGSIPGMKFYNNTFYRAGYAASAFGFGARTYEGTPANPGFGFGGTTGTNYATGTKFYNNIFLDCGVNDGAFGYSVNLDSLTGCSADYNYVSRTELCPSTSG